MARAFLLGVQHEWGMRAHRAGARVRCNFLLGVLCVVVQWMRWVVARAAAQHGSTPLHFAAGRKASAAVTRRLLSVNAQAAKTADRVSAPPPPSLAPALARGSRAARRLCRAAALASPAQQGNLPLHVAARFGAPPEAARLIYEAHPDALAAKGHVRRPVRPPPPRLRAPRDVPLAPPPSLPSPHPLSGFM